MSSKSTFLTRFAKKETLKKQSFELPQPLLDSIEDYCAYAGLNDVKVDRNEIAAESIKDFLLRDSGFQSYLRTKADQAPAKNSAAT